MASSDATVCVVQARVGSSRLPGKVLADLGGQPMLGFQLNRLRGLQGITLVVATSTMARDDAIEEITQSAGVAVIRGSEQDVLGRFLGVLDHFPADTVIRLTADCPLADPDVIAAVLSRHHECDADYTSNTLPRTFPRGLDVEVISANALQVAGREASLDFEREHVTPFLYRHPERFRLANLRTSELLGDERWTVDTPEDLARVREIVRTMAPSTSFSWHSALVAFGTRHDPGVGRVHLRPSTFEDADRLLNWRNEALSVRNSESGREVALDEHRDWYRGVLNNPGTRLWIGELDGLPIGMVRIEVRASEGRVSMVVDPLYRHKGVGHQLLSSVQEALVGDFQIDRLVARVALGNEASKRLFVGCNFIEIGTAGEFVDLHWISRSADRSDLSS